ncbi:MAG: DUF1573 domain-containing protein [Verrucomicrobiia bacterium]
MKRGFLAAAVLLGLAGVWVLAAAPASNNPSGPRIKVDKSVYDFGKVSDVDRVNGTFVIENTGDGVLKIGRPTTTCGCTVAGVKPDTLKPGEKAELAFTLALGRSRAIFQKHIVVDSNDPTNPRVTLTVKADYTPLYDTKPLSYYLNLRKGQETNLVTRVTRTDGKVLNVTKVEPTREWIQAKADREPNATENTARILLSLKPDGSPGYFTEYLRVFVDDGKEPAFNLTMTGRILGDLNWTPENLYWPISDANKAVTSRRVVMRTMLENALEVKNVTSSLENLKVEVVKKPDGKSLELVATLTSIPATSVNGMIRLETNVPSQPTVEVPVWINIVQRPVAQQVPQAAPRAPHSSSRGPQAPPPLPQPARQ